MNGVGGRDFLSLAILDPLPKRTLERMRAGEYIDFAELPPAKGKGRLVSNALEGQVIVVQAADLLQSRKIIPDFATWVQCFGLYATAIATHQPERLPDLMAYQGTIARCSLKYKWPSWVVYDQNFRQEAAGNAGQPRARVDPSMYAQCFTGQEISGENWCRKCQSLDHNCPYSRKRSWNAANAGGTSYTPSRSPALGGGGEQQICI